MDVTLVQMDVPECDSGFSAVTVLADENTLVFGYQVFDADGDLENCAVIHVPDCIIFKFGAPNDEILHGHRYSSKGLGHYSAYEVLNSDWIQELIAANRVHPRHNESLFNSNRHFIFTFHDSTLEFITSDKIRISRIEGKLVPHLLIKFLSVGS